MGDSSAAVVLHFQTYSLISVPFCGRPVFVFSSFFFFNPKFKKLLELQNIIFESHCIYF